MTPRRILCPIDFSPGSQDAQRVARRIANEVHAALVLVRESIAETILDFAEATDLIVMGTHGRTGRVVRHAPCTVLVIRHHHTLEPYRHILVPVDFSECSRLALDEAGALAIRSGAMLTLLHVLELPAMYGEDVELDAAGELDDWGDGIETRLHTGVDRLVRTGNPAAQVLSTVAEDPSVDLVVVGSHGRTGVQRLLIGSVAEKVVRHATRPVMVAR